MGRIVNIKSLSKLARRRAYEAGYNLDTGERETTDKRDWFSRSSGGGSESSSKSTVKTETQKVTVSQPAQTKATEQTKTKIVELTNQKQTKSSSDPRMITRTAELKIRHGTGEQYLKYDTGEIKRVKTNPVADMVRQGGKVKITRGAGGRPKISEVTPPQDWKEIKDDKGQIVAYEGQQSPTKIRERDYFVTVPQEPEKTQVIWAWGQRGGQGRAYAGYGAPYETQLRSSADKDRFKADRARSEGKVGFFYEVSANIKKGLAGGIETTKKPLPYIVVAGSTLIATKSPKLAVVAGEIATPLYYGYTLTELKKGRDPAELAGEGVALWGISKATQKATQTVVSGVATAKTKIQTKIASIKMNKLERSIMDNYPYKIKEGVSGSQRDLWGTSVSDSKVKSSIQDLNKFKIGYGIEQNPLVSTNTYSPTGQTKLSQDKIFAIDSLGNIRQTQIKAGNVFVKDPKLNKFLEFNPKHYSLITINPNPANLPKTPIPRIDKSSQTNLIDNAPKNVDKTIKEIYGQIKTPAKSSGGSGGEPTLFSRTGSASTHAQTTNPLSTIGTSSNYQTYITQEPKGKTINQLLEKGSVLMFPLLSPPKSTQSPKPPQIRQVNEVLRVNVPKFNISISSGLKASNKKLVTAQQNKQDSKADQDIKISQDLFQIKRAKGAQGQDSSQDLAQILGQKQATIQKQVLKQQQAQAEALKSVLKQPLKTPTARVVDPFNLTPSVNFQIPKFDLGVNKKGSKFYLIGSKPRKLGPKYQPTVKSIFFNERGRAKKGLLTGLEERPIPIFKKKKKKKRKK